MLIANKKYSDANRNSQREKRYLDITFATTLRVWKTSPEGGCYEIKMVNPWFIAGISLLCKNAVA
jgi:hypothetical protein